MYNHLFFGFAHEVAQTAVEWYRVQCGIVFEVMRLDKSPIVDKGDIA
jgi:hypothetical protein